MCMDLFVRFMCTGLTSWREQLAEFAPLERLSAEPLSEHCERARLAAAARPGENEHSASAARRLRAGDGEVGHCEQLTQRVLELFQLSRVYNQLSLQ